MKVWNNVLANLLHKAGFKYTNTPEVSKILIWLWENHKIWVSVYPAGDKWTSTIIIKDNFPYESEELYDSYDSAYTNSFEWVLKNKIAYKKVKKN